jgi:DNA-binding transcriptional LysR family regulator
VRWVAVATAAVVRSLGTVRAWTDAPWIAWGERLSGIPPARWLATHAGAVEPVVRSDSLALQLALAVQGVGALLAPEPSAQHYGLVPLRLGKPLRAAAADWPSDDLHLVTHRALRQVPRVRVVWDLLVERATRTG